MSPAPPPPRGSDPRPLATLSYAAWVFAWLAALGGATLAAWLTRPLPEGLPWVGGRAQAPRPLLVVVVDGLREAALWEETDTLPFVRALSAEGVGGVALAGDPTLTAACVRTLLTGRLPDLITGLKNFEAPPVAGSWVEMQRALGARVAHGGDAAIAQICARSLDPRDVLAFPDRGPVDQGECDAAAVPFVLARIAEGVPVVTLHLTAPDHAGHRHGALGPEYRAACRRVDDSVREVVQAFRARHAEATVLVAADHGVSPGGTHGGGETSARRAPFVLVGPGIGRRSGVEVSQAALAPTLCAALGLPQPPLADAPPVVEWLTLPEMERQRALDAHLQARLAVARRLGSAAADPIERKRAELALARLDPAAAERLRGLAAALEREVEPPATPLRLVVLMLAALGLLAFVRASPLRGGAAFGAWLGLAGAGLTFAAALDVLPGPSLPPTVGAVLAGLGCLGALRAARRAAPEPASVLGAALAALPVLLAGGLSLQSFAERRAALAGTLLPTALGGLLGLGLLAALRQRRALRVRLARWARGAPTVAVALLGAALGVLLAKRNLIDPFVPLNLLVALACLGGLLLALRARPRRAAPRRGRALLLGLGVLLLALPWLVTGGANTIFWTQQIPARSTGFALAGLLVALALVAGLPRPFAAGRDRAGALLGLAAVGAAFLGNLAFRTGTVDLPWLARVLLAFGPQALALAALLLPLLRTGSAEGALAARLLAGLALARRLTASDAEFLMVALLLLAVLAAARLPFAARRPGLALLAVLLLLARTAAFHAAGGVEDRSTVDVGTGFYGLEELVGPRAAPLAATPPPAAAPTEAAAPPAAGAEPWAALAEGLPRWVPGRGGGGVTWQVVVATGMLSLRFAVPWLALLAAAAYALGRPGAVRTLLADLALSFGARATALVLCLWALASNAWWVGTAQEVVSLGAADLLLLVLAGGAVGAFARAAPGRAGIAVAPPGGVPSGA